MRRFHLIDTSVASDNVGDRIIVEAARRQLSPVLADAHICRSSGHHGPGAFGRDLVKKADLVLMLGTNVLSARCWLNHHFIWRDLMVLRGKVVLLGVGGNRDFEKMDWRRCWFLGQLLSREHVHSVRDSVGERIVRQAGHKVINTSCPTLWTPPAAVPEGKAHCAVFTLSAHKPHKTAARLIATLLQLYPEVWCCPQQPRDLDYLRKLPGHDHVRIVAANLPSHDALLAAAPIDVVDTRLHGTIRALHHNRRSLAIVIVNRARDIGAEVGLPIIGRDEITGQLATRLQGPNTTNLTLPQAAITSFLNQFRVAA
jgi:polysaccharide pyruvyl transferase WcaK-like protein